MFQKIYITGLLLVVAGAATAQKTERDYLRSGNKLYNDSLFIKAEVDYRKALDVEPQSADAMFNLANSLLMQEKAKEAMEMFETAAKVEKDKDKLAEAYHNMGVILQASKQYAPAVEAYKKALRNNPKDDETRYNLALAQKMLKDQEQEQENQDQNQDQEQDQQQQEKEQDQNQDQEKDKQDQNKEEQKEQEQKDQQNQQQQQQNPSQMSKENAEQLLNAVMQDEKEVQEKVQKQLQMQGKKLEKDW
ncbi:MAG: tetratricopeptide repeat protein [Phocaeicola sp.]